MSKLERNRRIWDYIIVIFMILISGGVIFFMMYALLFVPLFFVCSLLYFIRFKRKTDTVNLRILLFIFIYFLISYHFVAGDHVEGQFNTYIVYQILLVSSFFVISTISFERFRNCYTNICCYLTIISSILFLLVMLNIVRPQFYNNYLLVFLDVYGESRILGRLHGPFWEPGVLQIVLNIALILNIDKLICLKQFRKETWKYIVIVSGILLTISTAGYINLLYIGVVCLLSSGLLKKNILLTIAVLVISTMFVSLLLLSDAIQGKLAQQGEDETSYEIRMADNLGMWNMTMERPFVGYGLASKEYDDRSWFMNNRTSSNGILFITSHIGIPFLLFYLIFIYCGIRRICKKKIGIMLFPVIVLLQTTEVFFYFPLSYIFLYKFNQKNLRVCTKY